MTRRLSIEGMSCGHCIARVKTALSEVPGVAKAEVDLDKKIAVVEGTGLDDALLEAAVGEAGYEVVAIS
jgi:copper chaperone